MLLPCSSHPHHRFLGEHHRQQNVRTFYFLVRSRSLLLLLYIVQICALTTCFALLLSQHRIPNLRSTSSDKVPRPPAMKRLLAFPSTLLLIVATASGDSHPLNGGRGLQSRAESKEDALIHQLAAQAPVALRKMSPGEKFYPHYWQFDFEQQTTPSTLAGDDSLTNTSISTDLLPPLHSHSDEAWKSSASLRHWPRNLFDKRDYQCPAGTGNCASIGRPNSCCATGEQCVHVTDTGSGDVGCCPAGATCGGSISSCNTAGGFIACPDSSNGGCCIPGYTCDSIGCECDFVL